MMKIIAVLAACGAAASANDVTVQTSHGSLVGTELENGANSFIGIPYAPKPDRFEPPSPWTTSYGAEGRSAKTMESRCAEGSEGSEDCLFMNVWTPTTATAASLLPILFFIHGGFKGEDVNSYDGAEISSTQGMVVATIHYRVGPLGFLATNEGGVLSGNVGMADQREAMQWLKKEAVHFGGNPNRILIVGETPGDMSVLHHTISPKSAGLFQRVLGEHGKPRSNSEEYGTGISSELGGILGCDQEGDALKACLASKSLDELLNADTTARWGPVVGASGDCPEQVEQVQRDAQYFADIEQSLNPIVDTDATSNAADDVHNADARAQGSVVNMFTDEATALGYILYN